MVGYIVCMNLLSWILFGAIVGIITHSIQQDRNTSMPGAITLGIAGAITGGILAIILFQGQMHGFDLTSFILAAGGSLFLLSIGRALKNG